MNELRDDENINTLNHNEEGYNNKKLFNNKSRLLKMNKKLNMIQ